MKETIYNKALEAVIHGAVFDVDFKAQTLKVKGVVLIDNGKYEGELGMELLPSEEILKEVNKLYHRYKHSIPSEQSCKRRRNYFRALPEAQLTDEDMLYGERRDITRYELEVFILMQTVLGFYWPEVMGRHFFWQSEEDEDLIVMRDWF